MLSIKRLLIALFLLFVSAAAWAGALRSGEEIYLWGEMRPPGGSLRAPAAAVSPSADRLHNNLIGISRPSLVAFVPDKPNGVSMIVVPGGGYIKLVAAKEGADIARWLNSLGITAFVLKHRLPDEGHADGRHVPLQDGQRAIRQIRQHAGEWQLDPARIGIIGFSAGGHLAASTGTAFDHNSYPSADAVDSLSARPDFMALIYAVVGFPATHGSTQGKESQTIYGEYATDEALSVDTPPAFMMVAANDGLARRNVRFWQVLQAAGNPAELHVVATGGHGFALKPDAAPSVRIWPELFRTWLQARCILDQEIAPDGRKP